MERFIQHDPIFIRHFIAKEYPYPLHNHNHFDLTFIHSGSGYHELNGTHTPYQGRSLFLLAPSDCHTFKIEHESEFSVLKFTNNYLDGGPSPAVNKEWNKIIDQLIAISSFYGTDLVKSASDLMKIDQLMRLIVSEWEESLNAPGEVMLYLIKSIFSLIKRSAIHSKVPENRLNGNLFISIMDYIHTHIHEPENLRIAVLSKKFNFSPSHISTLFKQQMGVALKVYIDDHRYKLIETRLKFSDLMIKEISNEFGFSDISHFNKFLKKHGGMNPKSIRNVHSSISSIKKSLHSIF